MGFPFLLEGGFETGATDFDTAITDTQSKSLGYLHYVDSVKLYGVVPYRGAYMWGIDQSVGTKTTACNQTQAAFNVADTYAYAVRAAIYLKGHTMTNGDRTSLITVRSAAADEAVIQLYYTTAGGLQLLCTKAYNTAVGSNPVCPISENQWHIVEIRGSVQTGGTGTINFFLNGIQVGSQITTLTNAAVTDLYVGATNGDSGHTTGYIFYDEIEADCDDGTAAITFGYKERWPDQITIGATRHAFMGPGTISGAAMLSSGSDNYCKLYDTDIAYSADGQNLVAELNPSIQSSIGGPLRFKRGCYAVLSGTSPRAQIFIDTTGQLEYMHFPKTLYYSNEAALKNYALRRKATTGNI